MNERNRDGLTEEEFLAKYRPGDYERPSFTADMLLFTADRIENSNLRNDDTKELKILLIKRNNHPFIHKWALPGGFVDIAESVEQAAYRELAEETNITGVYLEQLYTFSNPPRDPRMRVISTAHLALIPMDSVKPVAGDDAEDVAWFTIKRTLIENGASLRKYSLVISNRALNLSYQYQVEESLTSNGIVPTKHTLVTPVSEQDNRLAFDHVEEINMALDRLKNKVEYTPIVFNLLPPKFTLNEVQDLYELILGYPLVKQNFRVKIKKYVEELDEYQNHVGHRPAKLYQLRNLNLSEL